MNQTTDIKQLTAPIISNSEVMPGTYLIWLDCPEIADSARPGQFIMVRCGQANFLRRPLSIHRVADGTKLAFLFTVVGKGTQWLCRRKAGDTVDLLGPLGNGFHIEPDTPNLLLVAGGIGIAPLVFLAQRAVSQGLSVKLILGAVTADQLCPRHLIPPETEFIGTTDDGTAGIKGFVTNLLPGAIGKADQVFICGPAPMYRAMVKQYSPLLTTRPVQISLELRMGCGIGVCYSCTVKTSQGLKQVCQDGPVFNFEDILWDELS